MRQYRVAFSHNPQRFTFPNVRLASTEVRFNSSRRRMRVARSNIGCDKDADHLIIATVALPRRVRCRIHDDASSNHDVASPRPRCSIEDPGLHDRLVTASDARHSRPDLPCTMSLELIAWPLHFGGLLLRLVARLLPPITGSLCLFTRLRRLIAWSRRLDGWPARSDGLLDPPIAVRGASTSLSPRHHVFDGYGARVDATSSAAIGSPQRTIGSGATTCAISSSMCSLPVLAARSPSALPASARPSLASERDIRSCCPLLGKSPRRQKCSHRMPKFVTIAPNLTRA